MAADDLFWDFTGRRTLNFSPSNARKPQKVFGSESAKVFEIFVLFVATADPSIRFNRIRDHPRNPRGNDWELFRRGFRGWARMNLSPFPAHPTIS